MNLHKAKAVGALFLLLTLQGAPFRAAAQTPLASEKIELSLTAHDRRAALIPAGSTEVLIEVTADPGTQGGDLIDVVYFVPNAVVTLTLPNGTEVGSENAAAQGFNYGVFPEGAASSTPLGSLLSSTGTHTLIQLPQSASPGTYQVKVTVPATTTDTPVVVTYISSSRIRAGLTVNAKTYCVGDTVILMAVLFDELDPITGATVNAEVLNTASENAVPVHVTLSDSGGSDATPGDGIYTGSFTATQAGPFVAAIRAWGASVEGVSFSRSASAAFDVTLPLANFVSFQSGGIDEDADQFLDKLAVTADVDVQTPGDYKFDATLSAGNGAEVKTNTTAALQPGRQQISLQFSSKEILDLQADGPYKIKDAALFFLGDPGAPMVDFRAEVGETAAYELSSFISPLRPDLAITVVGPPEEVLVGGSLTYSLVVYNLGAASATGVVVSDQLPAGAVFVSATASQGTCSGTGPVSCDLGTLASGASAFVDLVVTPSEAGEYTNTAEVNTAGEVNPTNNSAAVTVNVAPQPTPTPTPAPTPVPDDAVLGIKQLPGYANGVDVAGKYVYVAAGAAGLQVLFFEPGRDENLELVGSLETPGNANGVKVVGNRAYVADGDAGLQIIDISSPNNPVLLGSADTPGEARRVAVSGGRAYVADGSGGLQIIDVTAPDAPSILGSVSMPGVVSGVGVSGDLAVTIEGPYSPLVLRVVNVSDPAAPQVVGELQLEASGKTNVVVSDRLAYIAAGVNGLLVVDFSDPGRPRVVSTVPPELYTASGYSRAFWPGDVSVKGAYAAATTVGSLTALLVLQDPMNPGAPRALDMSRAGVLYGLSVALDDTYVYTTADAGGTPSADEQGTTGETFLIINQYMPDAGAEENDSAGVAPTVTLSAPQDGQTVMEGRTITVIAEASDDVQVAGVKFSVNGNQIATDFVAPYRISYRTPLGVSALNVTAAAVDLAGNIGTAPPVTVTVIPDPPPVIAITNPAESAQLMVGQTISIGVEASDNVAVNEVLYKVNGETIYGPDYTVPPDAESLTIEATAVDNLGRATSATRTVSVIPDPGTTVTGVVVANRRPVADATVTVLDSTVQTGADGTFTIENVPTAQGDITGDFYTPEFGSQYRQFAPKVPVPGGVTDLGTLDFFPQYTTTLPEEPSAVMSVKDYNADYVDDILLSFPSPRNNVYLSDLNGRFTPDPADTLSLPGLLTGVSFGDIYGYANYTFAQLSGHPGVVTFVKNSSYFGNETDDSFATGLGSEARFMALSTLYTDRIVLAFLSGGSPGPQGLSVRFDDPQGGFTAPVTLPLEANTTLRSLKLADVTGDGWADILAVKQVSATDVRLVVYPRVTEMTFGAPVESSVTIRSGAGAVADDFAVGMFVSTGADIAVLGDDRVRLYRGDGTGSFASAGELPLPEGVTPTGIAAGPMWWGGGLSTRLIVTAKSAGAVSDKLVQVYQSETNEEGESTLGPPSVYTYSAPARPGDVRVIVGRFNNISGYDVVLVDGETLVSLMDILPEVF